MAITIGDLVVKVGLVGNDKTKEGLKGVRESMSGVKNMSFELKAGILGVLYGLQRITSNAAQTGNKLQIFSDFTQQSTEQLQRWQYAGRLAGVSADEITSSVMGLQKAMASIRMGQGAPGAMDIFSTLVGFDQNKMDDAFYMLGQIEKLVQMKSNDVGIMNNLAETFGLSPAMIGQMRAGKFSEKMLAQANPYSKGQISSLNNVYGQWGRYEDMVEKSIGNLVAKHGPKTISDLNKLTKAVLQLGDAFATLGEKAKILEVIGFAAELLTDFLQLMTAGVDSFNGKQVKKEGGIYGFFKDAIAAKYGGYGMAARGVTDFAERLINGPKESVGKPKPVPNKAPKIEPTATGKPTSQTNVFNIDGSRSPMDTAEAVQSKLNFAARQSPAQRQLT